MSPKELVKAARPARRQLFVARTAQGRLLLRATLCCTLCSVLASAASLALFKVTEMHPVPAWLLASLGTIFMTLPLVLFDAARLSNRLLGPFIRAQGAIRCLSHGDRVSPLLVRDHDDWHEWMQDFNAMVATVQSCSTERPKPLRLEEEVAEP